MFVGHNCINHIHYGVAVVSKSIYPSLGGILVLMKVTSMYARLVHILGEVALDLRYILLVAKSAIHYLI